MLRAQNLPHEGSKTIIRLFKDATAKLTARYDAVATLVWEPPDSVWIHGMMGRVNRTLLLDILDYMEENHVKTIKAKRAEGHRLPGGHIQPNGDVHLYVEELRERFPFNSAVAPLV